jgi:hypothetical protein
MLQRDDQQKVGERQSRAGLLETCRAAEQNRHVDEKKMKPTILTEAINHTKCVPEAGLEPARPQKEQGILSPWCLPFHHSGTDVACFII